MLGRPAVGRSSAPAAARHAARGDYRGDIALLDRVADLVKGPPVTCAPDASVAAAAQLMTSRGVDSVAVVDGREGAPIGIVTDRDLRAKVIADGLPPTTAVAHVMSARSCRSRRRGLPSTRCSR